MKIEPTSDGATLCINTMGRLVTVTAIFTSADEANDFMVKNSGQSVIAVFGSYVVLAHKDDEGVKLR